jgi:hypothetical protein
MWKEFDQIIVHRRDIPGLFIDFIFQHLGVGRIALRGGISHYDITGLIGTHLSDFALYKQR